jgi:hypothetical protein
MSIVEPEPMPEAYDTSELSEDLYTFTPQLEFAPRVESGVKFSEAGVMPELGVPVMVPEPLGVAGEQSPNSEVLDWSTKVRVASYWVAAAFKDMFP